MSVFIRVENIKHLNQLFQPSMQNKSVDTPIQASGDTPDARHYESFSVYIF